MKSARKNNEEAAIWLPIGDLKPWAQNPRQNEASIGKVAASIKRFGFGNPILARLEDNEIIAGHTRWAAAKQLGLERVPVRLMDLDPADAHLLALADNRLGEDAEWDDAGLARVLADLKAADADLAATGFGSDELARLLEGLDVERLAAVEEDDVPEPPDEPTSVDGEVYDLGPHRLICGDSTRLDHVERALGGRKADLLFTDPPYGVSYQSHMAKGGTASRFEPIENDDMTGENLQRFLADAFASAAAVMRPGAAAYVCHSDQKAGLRPAFESAFVSSGFHLAGCIVWVKPAATMGWQDYRNQYEPILYGWREGAERRKVEDRTQTTVWQIGRDAAASYEHPTQKPVDLPARAIENSTIAGETVLDLFGGSGSTLIAAARTGRRAVLVEKEPRYCDVIRTRWERLHAKAAR